MIALELDPLPALGTARDVALQKLAAGHRRRAEGELLLAEAYEALAQEPETTASTRGALAPGKFVNLTRAAELLGLGVSTVQRKIKAGQIEARRDGTRTWRIHRDELERYDEARKTRGNLRRAK